MVKIRKQFSQEKHGATLSPYVSRFIKLAENSTLEGLPGLLASFPKSWPFSRGDLYHWIEVLNRFDSIYELVTTRYRLLDGPQTITFNRRVLLQGDARDSELNQSCTASHASLDKHGFSVDGDRELVESILRFTVLLFENCGNRSLYSSSGRLDPLLNTANLSLLEEVLRLANRLAQRYTAARLRMAGPHYHLGPVNQSLLSTHYNIDLSKISAIAQPLTRIGAVDQEGNGGVTYPAIDRLEKLVASSEAVNGQKRFSLNEYRTELEAVFKSNFAELANDITVLSGALETQSGISTEALVGELVYGSGFQENEKWTDAYALLHHVRAVHAVHGDYDAKCRILSVRLLALANLAQIFPEPVLQKLVFSKEGSLPRHLQLPQLLCDLVNPPSDSTFVAPKSLQSLALVVLETLLRHKEKCTEVCTALNINVSHGMLATTVRRAVNEMISDGEESEREDDTKWIDSLFFLLHSLPKANNRAVEGLVSAGLVDMLIDIVTTRTLKAEKNQSVAVNFLTSFVYHTKDAFDALVNTKGLDAISELLSYEVDRSISLTRQGEGMPSEYKIKTNDYDIPYVNQQCLRALFKFVNSMLTISSGQIDRLLRNLVESSHVLDSLQTIMRNPRLFGSNIWTGAISVFSSFINNEPTSYAAIAEAGLTTAILETVTQRPTPASDAPNGESSDLETNASEKPGIRTVKGILPAAECMQSLPDTFGAICLNENGLVQFEKSGALETFFEIFTSPSHVKSLIRAGGTGGTEIERIGQSFDQLARHHPRLKPKVIELVVSTADRVARVVSSAPVSGFLQDDVEENSADPGQTSPSSDVEMKDASSVSDMPDDREQKSTATSVYISVYSKFLSAMFRNNSLCSTFAEKGGAESLLEFATAFKPSYVAMNGRSAVPCTHRLQRVIGTLADNKPHLLLPALLAKAQLYTDKLKPLIDSSTDAPFFAPFLGLTGEKFGHYTAEALSKMDVVKAIEPFDMLCNLFSKSLTPQRNAVTNPFITVNMADMCVQLIDSLSVLLRRVVREKQKMREVGHKDVLFMTHESIKTMQAGTANTNGTTQSEAVSSPMDQQGSSQNLLENELIFTISNTAFSIPDTIWNVYQAIAKSLFPRRLSSENYQRHLMLMMADRIAQALLDQLSVDNHFNATPSSMCLTARDNVRAVKQVLLPSPVQMDETGRFQLRTAVVVAFREKGGIPLLGIHARTLFEQSVEPQGQDESEETFKIRQTSAHDWLRECLEIFSHLVDQKAIHDASQTGALQSRSDRDRDKPEYFSQHQFLVELRLQVLDAVSDIWWSQSLEKSQSTIVRALSGIMQTILDGSGEHGAFKRSDKVAPRTKPSPKKWRPRSDQVRILEDKGYEKDLVREALYRCSDNVNYAEEYCSYYSNHPERSRHPVPSSELQATTPPDNNAPSRSNQEDNNVVTPARGGRPPTPLPRGGEVLAGSVGPASNAGETNSPQTAIIDALANMTQSILQDAEGSTLPTAGEPATSASSVQGATVDANLSKAADVSEIITIENLDEKRAQIRDDLIARCLYLLNAFSEVTFEMASLIVASVSKAPEPGAMRQDISGTLVMALVSYQGNENNQEDAKKIKAVAHLLGIIIQEKDFFDAAQESLRDSFSSLLGFLSFSQDTKLDEQSPWIPHILLIVERTIAEDAQPHKIQWITPGPDQTAAEQPIAEAPVPMIDLESRSELFNYLTGMMPKIGKDLEFGVAVIRVLVALTRYRDCAALLSQQRNLQRFFLMTKQLAPVMDEKMRNTCMLVLRNIIEDDETIRRLMRSEIRAAFEKSTRPIDTTAYTRSLYYCVLRAPEIFVEITNELLELSKFDRSQSPQNLTLKKIASTENTEEKKEVEPAESAAENGINGDELTLERPRTADVKPPVVDNPDGVIHVLLCELLQNKELEDRPPPQQEADTLENAEPSVVGQAALGIDYGSPTQEKKPTTKERFNAEEHPIYIYRCFILQCLTELLSSYNRAKVEFINFSRKADPKAATPAKPRSGVLNYLLNALLPTGTLQEAKDDNTKKASETSSLAIKVIVALCTRTNENGYSRRNELDTSQEQPELSFVRRFVLEHALKAFKDANASSEPFEMKYSKLASISSLFNNLLIGKQLTPPTYRRNEQREAHLVPTQKELAKIMFEKNFVAALTNCMSEIDHNIPDAEAVITAILTPLKLLTHTAIELSLSSDISSIRGGMTDEGDISSAESVSDLNEGREETPDLYRNSALGIFEPGRHEDSSSNSDEDEDDMYADDMEYDEVEPDGDDGDMISDEDEEMEGPIEGLPGDMGMDIEVEIDNGEEGSEDDDDEDDGDSDSGSDDENTSDDGEGSENDIEIMDDVTGDEENGSSNGSGESDGWGEGNFVPPPPPPDDHEHVLDLLSSVGPQHILAPPFDPDESHSDGDGEPHGDQVLELDADQPPTLPEHLELHMDPDEDPENDEVIEEFTEEEEDEEEEYEEDEIMYREYGDPEHEDPNMLPYVLTGPPGVPWPHRGPPLHRHSLANRTFTPARHGERYRFGDDRFHDPWDSHSRRNGTSANDDGANPLLRRDRRVNIWPNNDPHRRHELPPDMDFIPQIPRAPVRGPNEDAASFLSGARGWVSGAENYISGLLNALQRNGPLGLMAHHHLHHHHHHHPGGGAVSFRIGTPGGGDNAQMEIVMRQPDGATPEWPAPAEGNRAPPAAKNDPVRAVSFTAATTMERWQEEARLIFGSSYTEKCARVVNSILRLLVPPAIEADRIRKQKAAEDARKREEERARLEAEKAEKEAQEKREREEREAKERMEAEEASRNATEEQQADTANSTEAMEGVETSQNESTSAETAAAPAAPVARVYTNIRGRPVDITELGIDQTVLEELPEDLREEVIMQQFAEQRDQAARSGEDRGNLDPQFLEFLEAVPAEIRDELLQQDAQDRRRREREEARRQAAENSGHAAQAEDMDAASFMASLDPILRQSVLAEADEDTLASLPEELAAEARALGGHQRRRMDPARFLVDPQIAQMRDEQRRRMEQRAQADTQNGQGRSSRRPIVQMIDKSGVATLLRLMFLPGLSTTQITLHGILRNACGNTQTRSEIVSGLLAILQDGSNDPSSIDKSFLHLTQRARQPPVSKGTPVKKPSVTLPWTSETAPPPPQVLGGCLAALNALTQTIPHIPKFFLTEQETAVGSKSRSKSKGKGKDSRSSKFPLNDLMSLLSRESVIMNPQVMEQVAHLLQMVTLPLHSLLKKEKEENGESSEKTETQDESATGQASESTVAVPTADSTQATSETPAESTSVVTSQTLADGVASSSHQSGSAPGPIDTATAVEEDASKTTVAQEKPPEPKKPFVPPEIPEENLRLVINILTARDCGSKPFRDTLSTINNLSAIPQARAIFGQELVMRARELAKTLQAELKNLTKDIQDAGSEIEAQNLALTKFSPNGSDQAKLNRILTALDYLFDTKASENKHMSTEQSESLREEGDGLLTSLYEDITFSDVWNRLSTCLTTTRNVLINTQQSEKQSEQFFLHIATILLPLIESLMVVCKRLASSSSKAGDLIQVASAPTTPAPDSILKSIFFSFTDTHKKVLNDLVRHNPRLMSGSFSVLVKNSSVLEFDNKRNYFNRRLHHRAADARQYPHPTLQVNANRKNAFQDSYLCLNLKKAEDIKYGKLNIRFIGEEGVDAGGVTREWFQVFSRQMFDPNNALFNPVASDQTTFHPNELSAVNEEHLRYFNFIGRIIGKALYENRVLDCHFSRAVYKRILGKSVSMKDLETIDLDYTKSLQWMLDNDISDIITETFSVASDEFGVTKVIDLIENGREVPVTEENKQEYVRLMVEHKLTGSVKEQLEHLLHGFHEIVPKELISIFDENELELLISGVPEVDVDDWKANTDYHNYNASSPQIQWFWRAVRSFDKEERAKLLQFVTGTGKVPLNGFKELEGMNGYTRFSIHKDYGNKDRLPSSHTCFNQLDLPEYDSYDILRKSLYTAMTTGGDYFGFA